MPTEARNEGYIKASQSNYTAIKVQHYFLCLEKYIGSRTPPNWYYGAILYIDIENMLSQKKEYRWNNT